MNVDVSERAFENAIEATLLQRSEGAIAEERAAREESNGPSRTMCYTDLSNPSSYPTVSNSTFDEYLIVACRLCPKSEFI